LKPTTPFGVLPTFEIPGKPAVSQSNAILGYIGRTHGLLPADPWEALRLESLMGAAEDLRYEISRTFGIADAAELARRRGQLVEGTIRPWGAFMEKQITGPFAGGAAISVADVKLFVVLGWLKKGVLDHVPRDVLASFERLERLFESVTNHPKVAAWYARAR
jgi:glutathione S-transferase